MFEGRAFAERMPRRSTIEDHDHGQCELATTSAKLKVAKGSLNATFDHFKRLSINVQVAEAAEQERMKSKLRNCIQAVLDQVEESTGPYQLNVKAISRHWGRH